MQHAADHAAVERLALVGVHRVDHAEHAADVQHLDDVAGLHALGHVTRIAEQRLAMAERARDDVALADLGHAAARELERVVGGLVGQDLHDHDHAFLGRNVLGGDAHFIAEAAGLRDRSDLVDDYCTHHFPPARAWNMPVSETILEKPERILRRPFAMRLAVYALGDGHERVLRFDALDEQTTRAEQHVDLAGDALLRRQEQRLDVAAHRIEQLAFVHPVAIGTRERFLDALLARREHELLELAMRGEQRLGGRRFERDAALGADDGVAEVDAAADAIRRAECLELFDHFHGRHHLAVDADRAALLEFDGVFRRRARIRERVLRQHPAPNPECCLPRSAFPCHRWSRPTGRD